MDKNQQPQKERFTRKGPIRFEAILPFTIICAAIAAYFVLFFDFHLRKGVEWGGTILNDAEVNVDKVKTSFIKGSLLISRIQATNPLNPKQNRLELGKIEFKFSWDALLRGKVLIETAGMSGIQIDTPRSREGFVVPPNLDSTTDAIKEKLLGMAKASFERSSLADAAEMLKGMDPSSALKELKELKSSTHIKQLLDDFGKKETEWNKTIASLPSSKDLSALQQKISSIQMPSNPAEAPAKISEVTALIKESETKLAAVKDTTAKVQNDLDAYQKDIAQIDALAKADLSDIEKQLKLPELDGKKIAVQLFGKEILLKVADGQRYIALARKYMPAKSNKKKLDEPIKFERRKGKTYEFTVLHSYPKFWLKKAEISSADTHSPFGGKVTGQLANLTSNPALVGKPTILSLTGDFPHQEILGAELKVEFDHTKEIPEEKLLMKINQFPIPEKSLSNSEGIRLAINKAVGSAAINADLKGDNVLLAAKANYRNVAFDVGAKSEILDGVLKDVTKELKEIFVITTVTGTWSNLNFDVESNLALAIQAGLDRHIRAKVQETRKRIEGLVQERISAKRAELLGKYNGTKTKLTGEFEQRKKQAEEARSLATAKLSAVKNQAEGAKKKVFDQVKKKFPRF